MRTGGEKERQQEEDGAREGRQENMTAERDGGKEEAISTLGLILTATMEDPRTQAVLKHRPEVGRPPAEGESGRLRGDISVELDVWSLLISSVMSRFILPSPPQMVAASCTRNITRPRIEERREGLEGRI